MCVFITLVHFPQLQVKVFAMKNVYSEVAVSEDVVSEEKYNIFHYATGVRLSGMNLLCILVCLLTLPRHIRE